MKARMYPLILALATASAVCLWKQSPRAETTETFLASAPVPPSAILMLDNWVARMVVETYAAAARKLPVTGAKPACRLVLDADKAAVARLAAMTSLTPGTRSKLAAVAADLAKAMNTFIKQTYCTGAAITDVAGLKADLAALAGMI